MEERRCPLGDVQTEPFPRAFPFLPLAVTGGNAQASSTRHTSADRLRPRRAGSALRTSRPTGPACVPSPARMRPAAVAAGTMGPRRTRRVSAPRPRSVQRRERQLHLGLQTSDPGYATLTRLSADVLEQRSLADNDVTAEDPHGPGLREGSRERDPGSRVLANAAAESSSRRWPSRHSRPGTGSRDSVRTVSPVRHSATGTAQGGRPTAAALDQKPCRRQLEHIPGEERLSTRTSRGSRRSLIGARRPMRHSGGRPGRPDPGRIAPCPPSERIRSASYRAVLDRRAASRRSMSTRTLDARASSPA